MWVRQRKDSMVTASRADAKDTNRQSAITIKKFSIRNSITVSEVIIDTNVIIGFPQLVSQTDDDRVVLVETVQVLTQIVRVGQTVPAMLTELSRRQQNTILADVDALRPVLLHATT